MTSDTTLVVGAFVFIAASPFLDVRSITGQPSNLDPRRTRRQVTIKNPDAMSRLCRFDEVACAVYAADAVLLDCPT